MKKKVTLIILGTLVVFCLLLHILNIVKSNNNSNKSAQQIKVAYITDNDYVTYMRTSIRSIIANKKPNTEIEIYVLENDLSDTNKKKIQKEKRKNVNIELISIPNSLLNKFHCISKLNPLVSKIDNAKFFLPTLLKNVDKVIYLDGDTIVLKDLSDLYFTDLKNNYVGASDDWQTTWEKDKKGMRYFNNGVMLLNLQKMKENDTENKLIDYKLHDKNKRFVTQDAYNYVMYGKVLYLPLMYDTFAPEFENEKHLLHRIRKILNKHYDMKLYPYKTAKEYQKDVVIIHYCGYFNNKPWEGINFKRKANRIWYRYAPIDFWYECAIGKCKKPFYR